MDDDTPELDQTPPDGFIPQDGRDTQPGVYSREPDLITEAEEQPDTAIKEISGDASDDDDIDED